MHGIEYQLYQNSEVNQKWYIRTTKFNMLFTKLDIATSKTRLGIKYLDLLRIFVGGVRSIDS